MQLKKYGVVALLAAGAAVLIQVPEAQAIKKCVKFKTGRIVFAHFTDRADAQLAALRGLVKRTRKRYSQGYRPNPSSRDINCRPVYGGGQVKFI
ncbi:MAG: hypothetical protein AAF441_19255, partial [Pseudomonadota bacterium]